MPGSSERRGRSAVIVVLVALGLGLPGCGTDTGTADSGSTGATLPPDTDPLGIYFDTYAVGWSLGAGFDGESLSQVVLSGEVHAPELTVTFYEEAYFTTLDERHTCRWVGQVAIVEDDGLDAGDALWEGWRIGLTLAAPEGNTCQGFSPVRWGEDTPTTVLESTPLGIGLGPASASFVEELRDGLLRSGWTAADWDTYFGPFVYSTWFAAPTGPGGRLVGHEVNLTRTYEVDEDDVLVLDDQGSPVPVPLQDTLSIGYISSQTWRLYDARAWFPVPVGD